MASSIWCYCDVNVVADQIAVWRHAREVVEQFIVGYGVGLAQFLGELVDSPQDEEEAERHEVEDARDDHKNDNHQPRQPRLRPVKSTTVEVHMYS